MKYLLILSAAMLVCFGNLLTVNAQQEQKFIEKSQLPSQSAIPDDFVPKGWDVESYVQGDLTGDSIADVAVILMEANNYDNVDENEDFVRDRQRTLIILIKNSDGRYYPAAIANKLLHSTVYGAYNLRTTPPKLAINDGSLSINQTSGARNVANFTLNFRFDKATERFTLVEENVVVNDVMTDYSVNGQINYLLGTKITRSSIYDAELAKRVILSEEKASITPRKSFIEEIDYEAYYAD